MALQFWRRLPVSLQALVLQLLAAPLAWLLWQEVRHAQPQTSLQWGALAISQGVLAALLSFGVRLPWWWWWIQLLFWPALLAGMMIPALVSWAPFILLALLLIFGGVFRDRVPLFLSSQRVLQALLEVLKTRPSARVIDIGCGTGRVTCALQRQLPALRMMGVERALLPFALAWLRCRFTKPRPDVVLGSLWDCHLGDYDVVYAYLSPAPMPRLWQKVCAEMAEGSLFISNTFEVPGVAADQVITVDDWNQSKLFIWQIRHDQQGS